MSVHDAIVQLILIVLPAAILSLVNKFKKGSD
jgi:hypothetical protein